MSAGLGSNIGRLLCDNSFSWRRIRRENRAQRLEQLDWAFELRCMPAALNYRQPSKWELILHRARVIDGNEPVGGPPHNVDRNGKIAKLAVENVVGNL